MTLTRRDAATAVLAVVAVLVYLANSQNWNVPLLGGNRWAIAALGVLGLAMCTIGARLEGPWNAAMVVLGVLGTLAFVVLVLGLVTGAHALLSALIVLLLVLWTGATLRHALGHAQGRPIGAV